MEFETLKIGDFSEFEFTTINGGGVKKFIICSATVVYICDKFMVIIDNEDKPYLVLREKLKKIRKPHKA